MTPDINVSVTLTSGLRLEQALKKAGIDDPTTVTEMGEKVSPVSFEKKFYPSACNVEKFIYFCSVFIKAKENDKGIYRKRQPAGEEVRRVCMSTVGCDFYTDRYLFFRSGQKTDTQKLPEKADSRESGGRNKK